MPEDRNVRRQIAVASALALLGLSVLITVEILVRAGSPDTPEQQIAELFGLTVTIASLGSIVATWMKHKD